MVQRLLAKEKFVGSNPIARSCFSQWRRGQVVRQGSAKPLFRGSNPLDASNDLRFQIVYFRLMDALRRLFYSQYLYRSLIDCGALFYNGIKSLTYRGSGS